MGEQNYGTRLRHLQYIPKISYKLFIPFPFSFSFPFSDSFLSSSSFVPSNPGKPASKRQRLKHKIGIIIAILLVNQVGLFQIRSKL